MTHRFSLPVLLILITGYFSLLIEKPASAQKNDPYCIEAKKVFDAIESKHFRPVELNDAWSRNVFHIFISTLDPQGMLFTQPDYEKLLKYQNSIDDYIETCQNNFFAEVIQIYKQRIIDADTLISKITANPFNFSKNDVLELYNDSITFGKNVAELNTRWRKLLKYRTLNYLFTSNGHQINVNIIKENEPAARKIIARKQKQRLHRLLYPQSGFENQVAEQFYNSLALSFDPHSSYFSFSEKNNFESNLSAEHLSFGFEANETEDGEIEITRLVPGGPAWKSNELNKGDILVKVKWPKGETYDLSLMDGDEMEDLFESAEGLKAELTVRKANGQLKTVTLIKEKITTGDNTIKSLVLQGEHEIGYIYLPGFYTEWDDNSPSGCSMDMAKEVLKLRKENIEGIIIDLRYNGGGSMGEALALAGIFIDEGPLSVIQYSNSKPTVLKDINRGTIYDGPLLLLVNGLSASASEILAATLQDYNRAVIVGNPTFGKASSQVILPVEQVKGVAKQASGFVKITTGKIYRITGKSHQNTGVIPDIKLPGYMEFNQRESDSENALSSDSISKKVYYTPLPKLPINYLATKSEKRIKTNPGYTNISNFNLSMGNIFTNRDSINLNIAIFQKNEWNNYQKTKDLDSLVRIEATTYKVLNNKYDKQVIDLDTYKSETNSVLIKNVERDIYIEESYQIINDLINFNQNK